ncbi:hypothetical protein BDE02_11G069500 [Populus trichocarpa]|nr:hypothetical protein BDE02_11G069500 [Populus trichocarpa]
MIAIRYGSMPIARKTGDLNEMFLMLMMIPSLSDFQMALHS